MIKEHSNIHENLHFAGIKNFTLDTVGAGACLCGHRCNHSSKCHFGYNIWPGTG